LPQIFTVIGARPQFIKAAAVSRRIAETSGLDELLVHTGQHYDANSSKNSGYHSHRITSASPAAAMAR
jgi:UDP-N-acetylglucosamine 2-epimerase